MKFLIRQLLYGSLAILGLVGVWVHVLNYMDTSAVTSVQAFYLTALGVNSLTDLIHGNISNPAAATLVVAFFIVSILLTIWCYDECKRLKMRVCWCYILMIYFVSVPFGMEIFLLMREMVLNRERL